MLRSPFAPILLPGVGLGAGVARWLIQGSGNLYTALDKRFYVPDPDVGWRVSQLHPTWLGGEVIVICAGILVAVGIAGLWIRRRERKGLGARGLRLLAWGLGPLTWIPAIWAFSSGMGPIGGRESLAFGQVAAAPTTGTEGKLAAPAGTYDVIKHAGTSVTAQLDAGGETFDARFDGDIQGSWTGDPGNLAAPITATVSVATASVDTGIGERSRHAREAYLLAAQFPRITFALERVVAARQDAPDTAAFRGAGTVELMGRRHPVEVTGTLRTVDEAARARLNLPGAEAALLIQADFSLRIADTALAADAGDFGSPTIPLHVSLVLQRHQAN